MFLCFKGLDSLPGQIPGLLGQFRNKLTPLPIYIAKDSKVKAHLKKAGTPDAFLIGAMDHWPHSVGKKIYSYADL